MPSYDYISPFDAKFYRKKVKFGHSYLTYHSVGVGKNFLQNRRVVQFVATFTFVIVHVHTINNLYKVVVP